MTKRRKISIRKVIQVLLTLIVSTACVLAISSASRIEDTRRLNGIDMRISDENVYHFLDKTELLDTITNNKSIEQVPVSRLNISQMENKMLANPWVGGAQVYVDNNKMMHVRIEQRVPVARIFETTGSSYYLDTTLTQVPLSARYACYTLTVTNVPHLGDDSTGRSTKAQILAVVTQIEKDSFWNAMVSQVMIDSVYGFQLMPVLGNHIIMLGDTSRLQEKLNNVFSFYKKILNNIGWDKYEVLDVRFKGQLVASPALPWKPPAGKAVSNMDWVKSIMAQGAKEEGIDSAAIPQVKHDVVKSKILANAKTEKAKPPPKNAKPIATKDNKKDIKKTSITQQKQTNTNSPNKKRAI